MIQRAPQFSPNSVEKDKAILDAVAERLLARGHQVESIVEGESCLSVADAIFTMGRLPGTLAALKQLQGIIWKRLWNRQVCPYRLKMALMAIG